MAKAADLVLATIETMNEFRHDSSWEQVFKHTKEVATLYNIHIVPPRPRRSRIIPRRLQDEVILESKHK